jgi:hypothetical protein
MSILLPGCRPAASGPQAAGRVQPTYDQATGRLTRLAYDSNGNGKDDTWAYMDGARLVRLEADENEDGHIDRWEYYPADQNAGAGAAVSTAAGSVKQSPERIDRSTRFDGRVSRREFFEGGEMVRVEEDTSGDGVLDKWETYVNGALATTAIDTSGRGRPDRRFIYRPDGSLERIEADSTGAGRFVAVRP